MSLPITWKRRWVEELIYLFHEQRCLWDADCTEYKEVKARENALKVICERLRCDIPKITPSDVRAKIFNLRSQFRKQENQLNTGTTEPTLWCYDLLKFLKPVLRYRKALSEEDNKALANLYVHADKLNEPYCSSNSGMDLYIVRTPETGNVIDDPLSGTNDEDDWSISIGDTNKGTCAPLTKPNGIKPQVIETEAEIHAKSWAVEYQKLSSEQKILAKRKIDYILFQGRFGQLEMDSEESVCSTTNSSNNELMSLLKSMNRKFERMEEEILENKRLLLNNKTLVECRDLTKKICRTILSFPAKEASGDFNADVDTDVLKVFPIVNLDDIDSIERRLTDITYSDAILDYIKCLKVGSDGVDGVFRKMITDDVLQHYNWNGKWGKKALENVKLFNNILREIFEPMQMTAFDKEMKKSIEMSHRRMNSKRYTEKEKLKQN